MAPEDGSAPPPRKVRSACRRCRQKRVKVIDFLELSHYQQYSDDGSSVMAEFLPVATVLGQMFHVSTSIQAIMTCLSRESESLRPGFWILSEI